MKKKNLVFGLLSLCAMVSLASCNKASVLPGGDDNGKNPPADDSGNKVEDNGFKVTVKMPDGSIAKGVKVQWCDDKNCYAPVSVDDNGMASTSKLTTQLSEDGKYYVHILNCPEGYTYNPFEIVQTKDNKDETMTLKELNTYNEGANGTEANPYNLSVGYSSVSIEEGKNAWFSFSAKEAGTYTIESIAAATEVDHRINANIYKDGKRVASAEKSENEKNFTYNLEYTADDVTNNVTYSILVWITDEKATDQFGEGEFSLLVSKK